MKRVQDMIDGLRDSYKPSVEAALDDLEKDPSSLGIHSIGGSKYKLYAANGDVEIVFEMALSSNIINIDLIRPRSRANRLLKALKRALELYPQGTAPKGS